MVALVHIGCPNARRSNTRVLALYTPYTDSDLPDTFLTNWSVSYDYFELMISETNMSHHSSALHSVDPMVNGMYDAAIAEVLE